MVDSAIHHLCPAGRLLPYAGHRRAFGIKVEKFGLEVYCIDSDATDKTISVVEDLINNKEISYIYSFKEEKLSDKAKKLVDDHPSVKVEELHKLDNLSAEERSEKDYQVFYFYILHKQH